MNEVTKLEVIGGLDKTAIMQFQPSALEAATKERDRLLEKNKTILVITNADEAALVERALKANQRFAKAIEEVRAEFKAPVLQLGRKIDAVADALTGRIEADVKRFGQMHGSWQAEQNRIAEEARIKAHNEEIRLRREAEKKEADAKEALRKAELERLEKERAEKARLDKITKDEQDALEAKANRARSEAGRIKAEKEAQEARERREQEQRERDAAAAIDEQNRKEREEKDRLAREAELNRSVVDVRIEVATSAAVMEKPAGITTRRKIEFRVDDIVALYKENPLLVKLSPENALIKAALKNLPLGATLPGVTHWEEHASHVRE